MSKLPKGFISLGNGDTLNIDCIVSLRYSKKNNVPIITDIYGIEHYIDEKQAQKVKERKLLWWVSNKH